MNRFLRTLIAPALILGFCSAANSAMIYSSHYNNTSQTVYLGALYPTSYYGGNALTSGTSIEPNKNVAFALEITGSSYGFLYNYSALNWPFNACGLYVEGNKDPVTGKYSLSYLAHGMTNSCIANVVLANTTSGEFLFTVTQYGWWHSSGSYTN